MRVQKNILMDETSFEHANMLPRNSAISNIARVMAMALTVTQKEFDAYIQQNPELRVVVQYIAENVGNRFTRT